MDIKDLEVYGDQALDLTKAIREAENLPARESELKKYISEVMSGDVISKHSGIIKLRRCLCAQISTPIQQTLDSGVLPYLIELVKQDQHPHLKLEATWCLTNIASGDSHQVRMLVQKGVIQLFIHLLSKANIAIIEHAIWGLGNLAGDSIEFRDIVVMNYTMNNFVILYQQVKTTNKKLSEQIVWAASNLCRRRPAPDLAKIESGFAMFAEALLASDNKSVQIDSIWSLMALCKKTNAHRFVEFNLIPKLMELLDAEDAMIQQPAARIVGTLTNSGPEICDVEV